MRKNRYQQPNVVAAEQDQLPLESVCTILTRQSTALQGTRNVFSAEVNPQDLVATAQRFGFAPEHIRLVEADMGIGAYSTVIEDRPGLHKWLHDDLPSGTSRVVLVSQEDRLFRDATEIEHNRFIAQVAKYGGWVICGQTVYNFRHEFDRERFRMACKYGKQYIEHHIKGRLHPAIHRSAMAGRYSGGPVPWGYSVDYNQQSPTYKHFMRYEPHAVLVVAHVFDVFAAMSHPSVMEVARHWAREGLVWPVFGPDVDERRVNLVEKLVARDEVRSGYKFHFRQAQLILMNVAYLGWRARNGDIAREGLDGPPRICHEPLIDADVFWWCYDHVTAERPPWAPKRTTMLAVMSYHPRSQRRRNPDDVLFLAPGRVRCVQHGTMLGAKQYANGSIVLSCHGNDRFQLDETACSAFSVEPVNAALCHTFAEQLTLDEHDISELARLAERRQRIHVPEPTDLQRRLADEQTRFERAKRLSLLAGDDELAAEYLQEARHAKQVIRGLEQEAQTARDAVVPSSPFWSVAEHAATLAERIRSTFVDWPRQAQMRVLVLALHEGVLGRVDRFRFGLWLRWGGGAESRYLLPQKAGAFHPWTDAERDALRGYFDVLTWDALLTMFQGRTQPALRREAQRMGLHRDAREARVTNVPLIFAAPAAVNSMAGYGFEVDTHGTDEGYSPTGLSDLLSRQSTRSCSCD